jgi:hypothetical protein
MVVSAAALGQAVEKAKLTDKDKNEPIPAHIFLKRGAPVGNAKKVSLEKVFRDPSKYAGKLVRIEGFVVRSCKMEGCWAEIGSTRNAEQSVRVKMKDHGFFIPLRSAGAEARAEGVFTVKTLSKAEVDHLINDDGAKFDKRNPDGSVTELSFVATGIELRKTD